MEAILIGLMSVAVTAAILLGDLVSGRRFYWAVLKGFFRVASTVAGVLLGAVVYPGVCLGAWGYVRAAERNEEDFSELVDRS